MSAFWGVSPEVGHSWHRSLWHVTYSSCSFFEFPLWQPPSRPTHLKGRVCGWFFSSWTCTLLHFFLSESCQDRKGFFSCQSKFLTFLGLLLRDFSGKKWRLDPLLLTWRECTVSSWFWAHGSFLSTAPDLVLLEMGCNLQAPPFQLSMLSLHSNNVNGSR